jgi:ferredoxin
MTDLSAGLIARGVAPVRVHTEVFGSAALRAPAVVSGRPRRAPHPPSGPAGTGPEVSFTRSGLSVRWDDRFGSLLELAEACDVPAGWSCRMGVCHTCECGLVDGEVAYDPRPLTPPAAGDALTCCARPRGNVALEL